MVMWKQWYACVNESSLLQTCCYRTCSPQLWLGKLVWPGNSTVSLLQPGFSNGFVRSLSWSHLCYSILGYVAYPRLLLELQSLLVQTPRVGLMKMRTAMPLSCLFSY